MVPYDAQLKSHYLAYELLKRKLRISYVHQVTKSIKVEDLRNIYKNIHRGLKPSSGMLPGIERIPQNKESLLYASLFASLYRNASQLEICAEIDIPAMLFAWDFFCDMFPNHSRERRPYTEVRPANFTEAWVIAQALKIGLAELPYCEKCHGNTLVIYNSKFPLGCQICALNKTRKP